MKEYAKPVLSMKTLSEKICSDSIINTSWKDSWDSEGQIN